MISPREIAPAAPGAAGGIRGAARRADPIRRLRRLLAADRPLPKVLLGLAAGLLGQAAGEAVGAGAGRVRPAAGVAFAVGAAFGGWGIVGLVAGQLAVALATAPPSAALLVVLSDAVLAAIAHLTFRDAGRLGRGLPDLRSYLWVVAAALVGSLATALFLAWIDLEGRFLAGVGLYAVGNVTGVVLVGIPLLLLADRWLHRWLLPIPDEVPVDSEPRYDLAGDSTLPGSGVEGDATIVVRRPRRPLGRALLRSGLPILAVTLLAVPLAALSPAEGSWVVLLYLLPVIGAAQSFGLRGGVFVASVCGAAYLAVLLVASRLTGGDLLAEPHLPLYAQLLLLSPVGAYLGQARQQEARLRDELSTQSRLLHNDLLRVVRALTAAIEAKDAYTESHLRRVGEYAVATGSRLGLGGRALELLYYAAMLHDIGKIGVPETVLRKPGPLTRQEKALMQRHPEIGARIVAGLDLLRDAAPIILHHQERWDGSHDDGFPGYPRGLRGESIPLGSRIIAVVDAFDAMTTDRPYRDALTPAHAVDELRRHAGRQFDPAVVEAFLEVVAERPWH